MASPATSDLRNKNNSVVAKWATANIPNSVTKTPIQALKNIGKSSALGDFNKED